MTVTRVRRKTRATFSHSWCIVLHLKYDIFINILGYMLCLSLSIMRMRTLVLASLIRLLMMLTHYYIVEMHACIYMYYHYDYDYEYDVM